MAAGSAVLHRASRKRRQPCWNGTPEIYFAKPIDNSRLLKVEDPKRGREMRARMIEPRGALGDGQ